MLLPLIRFSLKRGIRLQEFVELSKELFINVATTELLKVGSEPSINRISLASGVHRKDVNRFNFGDKKKPAALDILTRIIGQWKNDPRFSKKSGDPKPLSFLKKEGDFADLVHSVSKELNPYSVLAELERLNLAKKEGNQISLIANEYTPQKDPNASFGLLEQDLTDLIAAVDCNTFSSLDIPSLHLSTRYDNICPEYIPKIRQWFMKEGEKIHHRARNFLSKYDKDLNPSLWQNKGGAKVSIGTFSHTEFESLIDEGNHE